ncbi:adenosylcobinamide kinase [Humibacillus sp. DSM 29435]|uniref:bifunctional adenosylcobinamide kinase/adenosylcobinamide-phosphate guanylyltransferase n=1 Tax=Humibacillus sp. DSM 29435 TaxID=1869167 RepID=UPI000871F2D1|nr:bifunctional adenosylcobinamide kinase/adenosylcobinamide-phosphate guanylyltransferase [Humibacillus sp. DSM 29435]OFE16343.1 adenosylcobinamide kinase [Humibacillus sp. DSM 29435]
MSVTLVTGPVRSGKSRHAESLLRGHLEVTYVATGPSADDAFETDAVDTEWAHRVRLHQERRPPGWLTLETHEVEAAVREATTPVLVDCLGTWLTAVVDEIGWDDLPAADRMLSTRVRTLTSALVAAQVPVVVVSNEVGWSLVPTTASGRFFQDQLGLLNAAVSAIAHHVHLVVAGRVLDLSGAALVPLGSRRGAPDA